MADPLPRAAGSGEAAAREPSAAPATPPGCELLDETGRGGMGVVRLARDVALDRDIAVKPLSERSPADSPGRPALPQGGADHRHEEVALRSRRVSDILLW
jgi:hypothetical protein